MLIQRDQVIADRPAVEVRDLTRPMRRTAHTVTGLAAELEVGLPEATRLAAELSAAGLVETTESYSGPYVVDARKTWPMANSHSYS